MSSNRKSAAPPSLGSGAAPLKPSSENGPSLSSTKLREELAQWGIEEFADIHFALVDVPPDALSDTVEELALHYFPGDVFRLPKDAFVQYTFGPFQVVAQPHKTQDTESARGRLVSTGGACVSVYASHSARFAKRTLPLLSFVMPKGYSPSHRVSVESLPLSNPASLEEVRLRLDYQRKVSSLLENGLRDAVQVNSHLIPYALVQDFHAEPGPLPAVIKKLTDAVAETSRTHHTFAVRRDLGDGYFLQATDVDRNGWRHFELCVETSSRPILEFDKRPGRYASGDRAP